MSEKNPVLELRRVNKSFGPIEVLNDISLKLHAGEVLCLLGDNGAGKSTLIKILSGVYTLSSGTMEMDGKPVTFTDPRQASTMGIATVHQFGGTFPLMSIGRSFFVGAEPTKGWGPFKIYDRKKANEIAADLQRIQRQETARLQLHDSRGSPAGNRYGFTAHAASGTGDG